MHERRYRASQAEARKKDAREKIQLGGLIIKAGLRSEDRAVILGALIDAVARLGDATERARLTAIGKAIFDNDSKEADAAGRTGIDDVGDRARAPGD
ncbi:conjugal transfer protein TraD [Mesorhizobium microcysteis]|uniref:Conjugal transfer protein TraD n=1 Tax=Neoaquamicrobium microcysteis TaxID=2682781 RepID=A0A5D4HB63_9HYPH|nr:conjugal transfer protein TraD [Mesorhizobium microcysteis]TYR36060.1 conjugal transfer protein TraD [Mesorhizobium microcysteis]